MEEVDGLWSKRGEMMHTPAVAAAFALDPEYWDHNTDESRGEKGHSGNRHSWLYVQVHFARSWCMP